MQPMQSILSAKSAQLFCRARSGFIERAHVYRALRVYRPRSRFTEIAHVLKKTDWGRRQKYRSRNGLPGLAIWPLLSIICTNNRSGWGIGGAEISEPNGSPRPVKWHVCYTIMRLRSRSWRNGNGAQISEMGEVTGFGKMQSFYALYSFIARPAKLEAAPEIHARKWNFRTV